MQSVRKYPFLPVVLLTLLTLVIAACGGSGQNTATPGTDNNSGKVSKDQQIYVWPIAGRSDLQSFDPALVTEGASIDAVNMVFTGLVQLNNKLEVYDQLAASHSLGSDGLTWTFKLRPNLKFSDGDPLTSEDVAYSLDRALAPELKSGVSPVYLGLIKDSDKRFAGDVKTLIGTSILTPDKDTVILKASQPAAYFLQILTYQTSYVVQKKMIDKYGDNFADHLSEGIGGAGPYKVSKYVRGQQIEFVPNPNYYGAKPQVQKVVMVFYRNADTLYRAYNSNQVDWAGVGSTDMEVAKKLPNNQFHLIPILDTAYFTMNYLAKPFNNIKIRQAFALALDKDAIATGVYKGTVVGTNHIIPPGMPGYNTSLTGPQGTTSIKGNPDLAKQLLQQGMTEEGYTASTFPSVKVTFSSLGSTDIRNEVAAEQQMWKQVLGIDVKVDDIDFNKLLELRHQTVNNPNGMQMWRLDWGADYPDPQNWLTLLFDKGSPKNAFNYGQNNTPAAAAQVENQKLMEQADINPDNTARMQQYNQAEQAIVNDVAWIPIFHDARTIVRKPCVVGIVDNPQSVVPPDDWANIYISTDKNCANTTPYR